MNKHLFIYKSRNFVITAPLWVRPDKVDWSKVLTISNEKRFTLAKGVFDYVHRHLLLFHIMTMWNENLIEIYSEFLIIHFFGVLQKYWTKHEQKLRFLISFRTHNYFVEVGLNDWSKVNYCRSFEDCGLETNVLKCIWSSYATIVFRYYPHLQNIVSDIKSVERNAFSRFILQLIKEMEEDDHQNIEFVIKWLVKLPYIRNGKFQDKIHTKMALFFCPR